MPEINPPIEPMTDQISDIERFALAYFKVRLTKQQIEVIKAVIAGKDLKLVRRRAGSGAAQRILYSYMQEGIKRGGRVRLPQVNLPSHMGRSKIKAATLEGKVLALIKRPGGAFNFELSRVSLRYGGTIHELRKDGHRITTTRQYLKNGRASNTYLYLYIGGPK